MQRKRRNINFGNFSKSPGNYQKKFNNSITNTTLHSIPTVRMSESNNKKSLVAKRNPFCGQFPKRFLCLGFATLLIFGLILTDVNLLNNHAYALEDAEEKEENNNTSMPKSLDDDALAEEKPELEEASVSTTNDDSTTNDTPVTFNTRAATAGLTIDGSTSSSTESVTVAPGSIAYSKEHTISVNVTDASAYTLKISGNTNLSGPSGATTIGGANNKTPATMTDNTWGYGWGGTGTAKESLYYQSLSTNGSKLSGDTLPSNGNVSFSRKLVFAAKFAANNTNSGTYTGKVTLSLAVTPKTATDLSEAKTMQELYQHPEICTNTQLISGQKYSAEYILTDDRTYPSGTNKTYKVRKFADGRCWMTENLRINNTTLKAASSDFSGSDIELPNSAKSDFTDANKFTYRSILLSEATAGSTGYYNWYTATAGAGNSSVTTNNQSVNTSICPKGWTLPTGGSTSNASTASTWTNFYGLFRNMGLTISNTNLKPGLNQGTSWGTGDLAKVQTDVDSNNKVIYNFKYTGYVVDGSLVGTSDGNWWSSTANDANGAYNLYIRSSYVYPGTYNRGRYFGFAVRCIARN